MWMIATDISSPLTWPPQGLYKEVWFLIGVLPDSFELAKMQM
jgi:hypothetical protein